MSIILKLNNVTKELENKVKTQKISNVRRKIKGSFKTLFMFINNKYIECIDLLYKNSGSSKSKNQLKNMISKQKDVTAIQNRKILNALNYFKVKIEVLNNRKNSRLLCDNSKLINKINSTFFILSNFLNKNNLMYIYRLKIFYNIRKIMYSYKVCTLKYQLDVQRETRSKDMDKEMIKEQEKIKQISLMTSIERKLYELSLNTCNRNINFYKSNVLAYSKFLVIKRKRTVENFFNVLQHHILEKIFLYLNIKRKTDKLNQRICESLFSILNLYTRRLELSTSKKLNFSSTEVKMYDDTLFKKEYLNFKILRSFLSLEKVIQYLKERFNNEISESFIFILSKGSLENDKRFIKLVDSTLRDIEKYDDPVVIRMGIQFILAKKYIGDIIFLKEQAELKENMIFGNRIK